MPDKSRDDLASILRVQRVAAESAAVNAISGLRGIARRLGLPGTETALADTAAALESETFKMIVMGRFKNGKSTLINALMGGTTQPVDLGGAEGPMVVDDLPATAVLSEVTYAETPYIRAWKLDGRAEQWTLADYLNRSTFTDDNEENVRRFAQIRQFEIGFPARLCESKVTLYDSPGLDENTIRASITMDVVRRCDAALMVYGTRTLMGQSELADDERVRNDGTHVFVVVNVFDGRKVDERLRGHVWNKYVRDHLHGPAWVGQDPAEYDIYFVNAKMAVDARYTLSGEAADQAYRDSGLAAFERRLTQFLIDDRLAIHLSTFTKKAVNLSDRILQNVSQQQAAVIADRDQFSTAWRSVVPEMVDLQARPERLPRIVDRYRDQAIMDLTFSITALIAGIRGDLPAHLASVTLPTESAKTFAVWHQKRLIQESADEINSFITRRITYWSSDEADKALRDITTQLNDEVGDEVAHLKRRFDAINMALTGWDSDAYGTSGNINSTTERVAAATAGLLFGETSAAVGGAGGWRGSAGGVVGAGAASWLLIGALGVTSGFVLLPVLAIAALGAAMAGSAGLATRIKRKALQAADERLALLPPEISRQIADNLTVRFAELKVAVSAEVTAFVIEQVRNIQDQVQRNQQREAEQEGTLQELKATGQDVLRRRQSLEKVIADSARA